MFFTYLRRELAGRRRQTAIVAIGMALAIALVIIVNSVAAGVQRRAGVGARVRLRRRHRHHRVAGPRRRPSEGEAGGGPAASSSAPDDGTTTGDSTEISQSRLTAGFGSTTFDASALDTVADVDGVAAASAALSLTNMTFNGELPQFVQQAEGEPPAEGDATQQQPPAGGFDGAGGSAFDVNTFTVLGIDPAGAAVGPLSAVELAEGRGLEASDAGQAVAVLDASYATSAELAVGDTIDVGGTDFEVVGTVTSTSADAATASNVYIPLDLAQSLAGLRRPGQRPLRAGDVVGPNRRGAGRHRGGAARRDRVDAGRPRRLACRARCRPHRAWSRTSASGSRSPCSPPRSSSRSSSRSRASRVAPASSAPSRRSAGRTAAWSARWPASRSCRASSAVPLGSRSGSSASG